MCRKGLADLLALGREVPSVLGAKSKASNFGRGDRPWLELIAYSQQASYEAPTIFFPTVLGIHLPYALGLLAWTLDARDDVATLAYYRRAARDFSDDGVTLCGAFGKRLGGRGGPLAAVVERLRRDPASRRTFVAVIDERDNTEEALEYPCAAGVRLFLREGELSWLTSMRAQQALTVFPYDAFLFSTLHQFVASELGVGTGVYRHFSGTFHIYRNEVGLAGEAVDDIRSLVLPGIPRGAAAAVAAELIGLEGALRRAAVAGDESDLRAVASGTPEWEFNEFALRVLARHAFESIGVSTAT